MKITKLTTICMFALGTLSLSTSCDSYLDTLPDDRANLNSLDKIQSLLTTGLSNKLPCMLMYMSSDNVTDNGKAYNYTPAMQDMYCFKDDNRRGNDDPALLWNSTYAAVGTANQALKALEDKTGKQADALRAEALLERAYGVFSISNAFCMAYDPTKADKYLGLPYPKVADEEVSRRGTLKELYENINADIEAALPMVDDGYLAVPKYHFNRKAAYAFAARFNLYYGNYDKAIKYATEAIGVDPSASLRQMDNYKSLAGLKDISNMYINSGEKANLMLQTAYSFMGRISLYDRYAHNLEILKYETFWALAPWEEGKMPNDQKSTLYESRRIFGAAPNTNFPKMEEIFEVTDKINQTGFPHIVNVAFSTDETLLVRAEAEIMKKDYAAAVRDMNYWIGAHCAESAKVFGGSALIKRPVLTEESVVKFMDELPESAVTPETPLERNLKKHLNPQGFTVEAGKQTSFIQLVLHMRRIETWKTGLRFMDLKRYGIEYTHKRDGEDPIVIKAGDKRLALQLPEDVLKATTGALEANPR